MMFEQINDNKIHWFYKDSFEMPLRYEMVGALLGLAIYNQVLLDIKFPMVVYKKIYGEKT